MAFSVSGWLERATEWIVPDLPPYDILATLAERGEGLSESDATAIDADVPRTGLPRTGLGELTVEHKEKLRRVLRAWSILRPDVGYAQSMNLVCSLALAVVGLDEPSAFLLFCALVERLGTEYFSGPPAASAIEPRTSPLSNRTSRSKHMRSSQALNRSRIHAFVCRSPAHPPLRGFQVEADVLLSVVGDCVPALADEDDPACQEVHLALRLWACRSFLPLWVGVLPLDAVLGVWNLVLMGDDDDGARQPPASASVCASSVSATSAAEAATVTRAAVAGLDPVATRAELAAAATASACACCDTTSPKVNRSVALQSPSSDADETGRGAASSVNVMVALAILSRCCDSVLEIVRDDGGADGLTAYAATAAFVTGAPPPPQQHCRAFASDPS